MEKKEFYRKLKEKIDYLEKKLKKNKVSGEIIHTYNPNKKQMTWEEVIEKMIENRLKNEGKIE